MSRNIIIPPVNTPGKDAASGTMELTLSLVGADKLPLPVADVANTLLMHGLGVHTISSQQLVLTLPTQDELPDLTYYRASVRQGRDVFTKDIQLPAGGDMTWAQFLALSDPVTGGLAWAARLLPEGATDGQFATYDAGTGTWIASTVAPGAGVEEAPVDGTPYARQDAGWVAAGTGGGTGDVSDGDTLTTGLTFPLAGLHILDTNASHDLILSPGSNLTADRTLTITTGDASRTLTLTGNASISGTNTGDQDLSGYSLTSHNHSGTYDPAGTAASAVSAHAGAADPHTVYALESSLGGAALLNVGTTTGTVAAGDDSRLSDARTPTSHVHGNISNAGAIGSTANLPIITTTSGVLTAGAFGTGATDFCVGNDSRLSDARTPSAHASSHASGQSDAIKLDDLAAPDDNTDLNASTTAHGLLLKATAPAAGLLSVVGIGNGETAYANKALFDNTNPADLGTAGPGTSLYAARRDHVHAAPSGSAADIDQYAVAARLSAGTGAYAGVAVADLTEETTPAAGDFLLGWESGGALRKFDIGDLPSGGGGVDTANSPGANEFARFVDADTIEGRTAAEVRADLDLEPGVDFLALRTSYIDGAILSVTGDAAISVSPGAVGIESGGILAWTSALTATGLSLSASTMYYVYVYDSGGTPTLQVSTTAPATAYLGQARSKTGASGYRFIDCLVTNSSGVLLRQSRSGAFIRYAGNVIAAPQRVLAAGTATTETDVSVLGCAPAFCQGVAISAVNVNSGAYSVSIYDSSGSGLLQGYSGTGANLPLTWPFVAIDSSGNISYKVSSGGSAYIDVLGYWLNR